jgi:hypothetical protein
MQQLDLKKSLESAVKQSIAQTYVLLFLAAKQGKRM